MKKNLERIKKWKDLQGEEFDVAKYLVMCKDLPKDMESYTKYYFACGHNINAKYRKYFLTDLRDIQGVVKWDNLLGHPFKTGQLEEVKSKLALGMFTWNQVQWIMYETARVLKIGGHFILTFRDFDKLLERKNSLTCKMFNRYINGNGQYFGSQRKSIWYPKAVIQVAEKYRMLMTEQCSVGMNTSITFIRTSRKLSSFKSEPKVNYDTDGNMINDGGDFPGA